MSGARTKPRTCRRSVAMIVAVAMAAAIGPVAAATDDLLVAGGADTFPVTVALGLAILGVVALIVFGVAMLVSRRRAAEVAEEAQRLESVFDVLEEGIVICGGMQIIAVNSSFCRLLDVPMPDVQGVMISNFVRDADVIDRLLSDAEVGIETQIQGGGEESIAVEITARTITYGGALRRLLALAGSR